MQAYLCQVSKLVAIWLTVIMVSFTCKDLLTYSGFFLNRAYISKNLCENRNNPAMQCNGRCYLNKSLKVSKGQEEGQRCPNHEIKQLSNLVYLVPSNLFEIPALVLSDGIFPVHGDNGLYVIDYVTKVFQPPRLD